MKHTFTKTEVSPTRDSATVYIGSPWREGTFKGRIANLVVSQSAAPAEAPPPSQENEGRIISVSYRDTGSNRVF